MKELAERVLVDQEAVRQFVEAPDAVTRRAAARYKAQVYEENGRRAAEIFRKLGFLGRRDIGEAGVRHFWLLVQHADHDPEFQQQVLEALSVAALVGEAGRAEYAMLWDRTRRNRGEPQMFGTQFQYLESGRAVPQPLRDAACVDALRSGVGLEPLAEYLKEMTQARERTEQLRGAARHGD